jgi:hypothetical protein
MGPVSQGQSVRLAKSSAHENRCGMVKRGCLDESLEIFKVRTVGFDGFGFSAARKASSSLEAAERSRAPAGETGTGA